MILIKEILESIYRNYKKFTNRSVCTSLVHELSENGISIKKNFLSKQQCDSLCRKIDDMIIGSKVNIWRDEQGADNRIYFVNEIDDEMNDFYHHPVIRKALLDYTGTTDPAGMLLAAKIEYKDGNIGSGGGWHRDSPITHQFKAICYLNDVTDQNGPFEYIKGSHKKIQVLKSYFRRVFKAGQYRFTDYEIKSYLESFNTCSSKITGEAGTLVFADTKGIHRGNPLISGSRYVLFCYFWDKEIPIHFEKLRQVGFK